MLTGLKNLDLLILNKLEDQDLVNVCKTNTKANKICYDQNFWLNRIMIKFPYLGLDLLKKYKRDRSWSQYYIEDLRAKNLPKHLLANIDKNRLDLVIIAVNKGADIHQMHDYPIRLASEKGRLGVVKYLAEQGADIYSFDDQALKLASLNGHLDIVKYLVSIGANIHAGNNSAIRWALQSGSIDVVDYLVSQGVPDPRI